MTWYAHKNRFWSFSRLAFEGFSFLSVSLFALWPGVRVYIYRSNLSSFTHYTIWSCLILIDSNLIFNSSNGVGLSTVEIHGRTSQFDHQSVRPVRDVSSRGCRTKVLVLDSIRTNAWKRSSLSFVNERQSNPTSPSFAVLVSVVWPNWSRRKSSFPMRKFHIFLVRRSWVIAAI